MSQAVPVEESQFASVVRMKEWQTPDGWDCVTFYLGKIQVARIVHDERMEPPWCVVARPSINGWKDYDHRFETKEVAMECVKDILSLRMKS